MFYFKVNQKDAMKSVGTLKGTGQAIRFGTPASKDSYGDFFVPETETGLRNGDVRPALVDHSFNAYFKENIVGYKTFEKDGDGWAYEIEFLDNEFGQKAHEECQSGCYRSSTGAVYHTVRQEHVGDGAYKMKTWLVGESSVTKSPADFFNGAVSAKHFIDSLKADEINKVFTLPQILQQIEMLNAFAKSFVIPDTQIEYQVEIVEKPIVEAVSLQFSEEQIADIAELTEQPFKLIERKLK